MKRLTKSFRPTLEVLEGRDVPSTTPLAIAPAAVPAARVPLASSSTALASSILHFCQVKLGQRVGGGECAHLAVEALRTSGAEFVFTDTDYAHVDYGGDRANDYLWGNLVRIFDTARFPVDSNPLAPIRPGDVLQYSHTVFSNGTFTSSQHTSIVAAVDSRGMPTRVYEQNFNNHRYVTLDAIDLSKITSGWVRVYRPVARRNEAGPYEFTVVNNTSRPVTLTLDGGNPVTLDRANTAGSDLFFYAFDPVSLAVGSSASIQVVNAGGYEVFHAFNGVVGIHRLVDPAPSQTLTDPASTAPTAIYFTIRNSTPSPVTFSLHGSGLANTLLPWHLGTYAATNTDPYIQLDTGARFQLTGGDFEVATIAGHLGFRLRAAQQHTFFTIRNGTETAITFSLLGSGASYTLNPGQVGSYLTYNTLPYVQLTSGSFYLTDGNFEVYHALSGSLDLRWRTTAQQDTYYTVRNGTTAAVTFSLHGTGQTHTLLPGQVGSYYSSNASPFLTLSNGRSYGLVDGNYEIDGVAGQLALRSRTAPGTTTFTIRNSTTAAVTFSLHGTGQSVTLQPGQAGSYLAGNADPYLELSSGVRVLLLNGDFELYQDSLGRLGLRWRTAPLFA